MDADGRRKKFFLHSAVLFTLTPSFLLILTGPSDLLRPRTFSKYTAAPPDCSVSHAPSAPPAPPTSPAPRVLWRP